jgi:hypothetical protein
MALAFDKFHRNHSGFLHNIEYTWKTLQTQAGYILKTRQAK